MIDDAFLKMVVCPRDRVPLVRADDALLARLNEAIDQRRIEKVGGGRVEDRLEGGLVREDRKLLYPVVADIPVLLADEAIALDQLAQPEE
jgi:uncharacterized protein YbaR (Trm112 family)